MTTQMKKYIRNLFMHLKKYTATEEYQEIQQIKNENDLLQFHEKYLKKLVLHAYRNVPYYRKIFDNIEIVNKDNVNLSLFHKIPILTKEILIKQQKELISTDYAERESYYNFSGGSTGEPTKFMQNYSYKKWCKASNKYYYQNMLNIDYGNSKKIFLWGSPRDLFEGKVGFRNKINDWLNNSIILNSFKMTDNDMKSYILKINSYKPDFIRGYASSLDELAKYIERNNIIIYKPKKIVSSAETLTSEMKTNIETVFGTRVYDFYGSRETASIAGECKDNLIHIFSFNNYLEILDRNNNPVKEGQEGRIIVTNLHNYSMPFIRYEIGDAAILGPKKCNCESFLPSLEKISGRLEENFIKKDGSIVIGYFFVHLIGVLLNKGFIKKFKVIQEDYDKIKIYAVLDRGLLRTDRNEIEEKIRLQMGSDCSILWEFVEDIPNAQSGKFLYTKSLVKN